MVRLVNLHGRPLVRCTIFESFPCKKEPRNSRNSAEKFLAFHAFLHIRKSQESQESLGFPGKLGDSWLQEIPHFPGFPRFHSLPESQECDSQKPGEAWKARKKCSALSVSVSWEAWDANLKSLKKCGKPGINIPHFPGFSLCAKERGKPGMIPSFPGFPGLHGFLQSMEYQPEKSGKARRVRNNYSTLSWLFLYKKA